MLDILNYQQRIRGGIRPLPPTQLVCRLWPIQRRNKREIWDTLNWPPAEYYWMHHCELLQSPEVRHDIARLSKIYVGVVKIYVGVVKMYVTVVNIYVGLLSKFT